MAIKPNEIDINECKGLTIKSDDEIKKYEIQEDLSEIDKAMLLLTKSNNAQKISVRTSTGTH